LLLLLLLLSVDFSQRKNYTDRATDADVPTFAGRIFMRSVLRVPTAVYLFSRPSRYFFFHIAA
jgi:hypothetical protein